MAWLCILIGHRLEFDFFWSQLRFDRCRRCGVTKPVYL